VVFLTGATGFVGAHVARALTRRGAAVRCLVRPSSRRDLLASLATLADGTEGSIEPFVGDLTDRASLDRGLAGCHTAYHCAADYRLYARDPRQIYAANVDGTENLLAAAARAGVARVVHTSSVGALGLLPGGAPADETTAVTEADVIGHYKRSKFLAERRAEAWAAQGLPVVIVNPSTPVGEMDVKPTPTGQMIVDFLDGRIPAYVESGLNLVDVRDVAEGHLLAAERGEPGRKYILGHENLTLKEIFDRLARLTGLPSPRLKLPHAIPLAVAAVDTALARLTGRTPRVSLESVRMSRKTMFFDGSRAVRELGMPQSPVDDALERAVAWFREHGYVTRGPLAKGGA
jgi:dihydroflavonol-4-reductase